MKTIASLKGPDFLRACNRTRHAVSDFLTATNVLDLRKVMPVIPDDTTEEQKQELLEKQGKKNISAMLDRMLDEYPEETYNLLLTLTLPEGEEDPDGLDLITAGLDLITAPKVMAFFTKLMELAPTTTEG